MSGDRLENPVDVSRTLDGVIFAFFQIKIFQRCCLVVIDGEPFFDRLEIVVGAAGVAAAFQEAVDEFFVVDFEADDRVEVGAALAKHRAEFFSLIDCAGEAVENHPVLDFLGMAVEFVGEHADHQIVGNQMALGNVGVGETAEFGVGCNLSAEDLAGRDMMEIVAVYEFFALSALATAGGTENNEIKHVLIMIGNRCL